MIVASAFGIFFASEDVGVTSKPMNQVIQEINKEFMAKIEETKNATPHEGYVLEGTRTDWKEILAVYAIDIGQGKNATDVIIMNESKQNTLKEIFWKMNTIESNTKSEMNYYLKGGLIDGFEIEEKEVVTLHITVKNKTAMQIAEEYMWNEDAKKQVQELLSDDYAKMWNAVIYGSGGNSDIVAVALAELEGNAGGKKYWSWYGFDTYEEWCACFVSWCASECGYIESGIIPKFASVPDGITFFKVCGLWQDKSYTPKAGDIIFFDWADDGRDGQGDHVGIVESVAEGKVHTVEGNSGNDVKQLQYELTSEDVLGYGTPMY
jgi:hypothetical protein